MKDLKSYFCYRVNPNREWWIKTPPRRNEHFERELELLGGTNTFGNPILRVVWGGTIKSDVASRDTLKYKQIWKGLTAYTYIDGDVIKTVSPLADIPKGAVVAPVYSAIELGQTRWVIEKWQSVEDAIRCGRFTDALGEDGTKLFRSPPPAGVYNAFIVVESYDKKFRDLDNAVLGEIKKTWHWNVTKTLEEKTADLIADEKKEEATARAEARAAWQN